MAFIARDRPDAAAVWLELILNHGRSLSELPDRGRIVPEFGRKNIRELIVSPFRLVYRRDVDVVTVVMVIHERRDLGRQDPE